MNRSRFLARCLCLGVLGTTPHITRADVLDPNFTSTVWVQATGSATGMAWAPDGSNRLFVTIKEGAVRVIENGTLLPTPFATDTVHTNSECGVIGIAFDPNFVQNHYVYVFATASNSEQQIIRYTESGNVGIERKVILQNLPTAGNNHDGGAVGFGPDGKLYWAIGDLGNGTGVDADLSTLAAKIGRANRDGTIPNDNPFFDGNGPNNDLIWARGFRNPFTFAFQPGTGLLWVNTVGSNWEQVFIAGPSKHAGYNDYENNQPDGFLPPVIAYRTNMSLTANLAASGGAVRSGNVVTFTTMSSLGLRKGMKVTVSGVADTSFNGDFFVGSVPSATTFSASQAGADATSTGGTVATLDIGGSITGGAFLDSSAVPAGYRGNFFFADYNTSRVERATLANDNSIESLDHWATNIASVTDVALGPDGALYMLAIGGAVHRASFNASAQALVVTPLHVRMDEAGRAAVSVRLAAAPVSDVVVSAAFSGGDPSLAVVAGNSLTFTAGNWATPQVVQFAAARDSDATEDLGMLTVSSNGLTSETVEVRATDEGNITLVLSTATLTATEGSSSTLTAALSSAPVAPVTVSVVRSSGPDSVSITEGAELTFTSANWSTPQTIRVAVAQDDDNEDATAQLKFTSAVVPERTVEVSVDDDDAAEPVFTSSPRTAAVAGARYIYDADASGRPVPTYSLATRPDGMTIDAASGEIEWTPESTGSFNVVVLASNGIEPAATQSFTLDVTEDRKPTCKVTRPAEGERIRGDKAEFYGDVMDDVQAVRAEFQVDGVVRSTDVNDDGHYHFGGAHNLFDSTQYRNGRHELSLIGYDNGGRSCTTTVNVTIANQGDTDDGGAPDAADGGKPGQDAGESLRIDDDGCSCRIADPRAPAAQTRLFPIGFVLVALALRRRRRRTRLAQPGTRDAGPT